jgi:hypothetical protein
MGRTSRAVIRGSRLFNAIFGLPRAGKYIAGSLGYAPERLPSRRITLSPRPRSLLDHSSLSAPILRPGGFVVS